MKKPSKDWKRVRYRSIYFRVGETAEGWLTPNGDIVGWWDMVFPPDWFTLSAKNEVAEIIAYL